MNPQDIIDALIEQRNAAQNEVASLRAQLVGVSRDTAARIEQLESELAQVVPCAEDA